MIARLAVESIRIYVGRVFGRLFGFCIIMFIIFRRMAVLCKRFFRNSFSI